MADNKAHTHKRTDASGLPNNNKQNA